jgi:large subunit ribosomal protein L29|tara:strand:- start:9108 stop:9314 length:207 start_codon:yes stop_codon:yes gene_type:complete
MKQEEINKLSDKDVQTNISNLSEKLMKTKLAHGVSPMENPIQIRGMRRTIARLKTELTKREAAATAKA